MSQSETVYCPLCGSSRLLRHAECKDCAGSGERYLVARCEKCGMIFTLGAPEESDTSNDRIDRDISPLVKPDGFLDWLYTMTRRVSMKRKARFVEKESRLSMGRLLNYGAKSGIFSSLMERRGWKVTSLEGNYERRRFSLEMFHHRMMDISEIDRLQPASFDVITMWHTFEHQAHPGPLMDRLFKLLKPSGILIIAAPNCDSADARFYRSDWAAWDVPRHLWHFNPVTMKATLQQKNFILMDHCRMPFDAFYISILSEKNRGSRCAVLKGFLRGIGFWIRGKRDRRKSSSIVYVFRKNNKERE